MQTVYEIVCHLKGDIRPLDRKHYRRYRSAAEAVQALGSYLTEGSFGHYAVEESRVSAGAATVDSSHVSVSLPTERVHARRVVAHAVPLPTAELGAAIGVLSFRVQRLDSEAATAAGLQIGDRVVSIGGVATEDAVALRTALERHEPGEVVPVVIEREGQTLSLTLKLTAGEPCGRYELEVLDGIAVPPVTRFSRIVTRKQIQVRARPLRSR